MNNLLILLYGFIIQLYGLFLHIAAFFHPKAKLWVTGRKGIFKRITSTFENESAPIIWMHCASLGEFEQGRPLIEEIKKEYSNYKVLLTFFSPSGYEIRKNYPFADFVFYLPLDTPKNAHRFLEIVQPKLVFFIKYDFWYFHLKKVQQQKIPLFLIAGVFRKNQLFFNRFGSWYLAILKGFDALFLQDQISNYLIENHGLKNGIVVGDPRIDRVVSVAKTAAQLPKISAFKADKLLMILGSSHLKEEQLFYDLIKKIKTKKYFENWKFLIAPHEVEEPHIVQIASQCPMPTIRYSKIENENILQENAILILDSIGLLSAVYRYGECVFIGGGFDKNIHNVLEPAVFGLPIIFGPKYDRFQEAKDLVNLGGAIVVKTIDHIDEIFEKVQNETVRKKLGTICQQYILKNSGATKQIIYYLNKKNVL